MSSGRCDEQFACADSLSGFASSIRKDELNDVCQPFVPDRTRSQTTTGLPGLVISTMNQICPDEVLPEDLLEVKYLLGVEDKTLAALILETRRADGKTYPGPTLRNSTSLYHFTQ